MLSIGCFETPILKVLSSIHAHCSLFDSLTMTPLSRFIDAIILRLLTSTHPGDDDDEDDDSELITIVPCTSQTRRTAAQLIACALPRRTVSSHSCTIQLPSARWLALLQRSSQQWHCIKQIRSGPVNRVFSAPTLRSLRTYLRPVPGLCHKHTIPTRNDVSRNELSCYKWLLNHVGVQNSSLLNGLLTIMSSRPIMAILVWGNLLQYCKTIIAYRCLETWSFPLVEVNNIGNMKEWQNRVHITRRERCRLGCELCVASVYDC